MQISYCSRKDWLSLRKPSPSSHKGDNGKLLIFAGSPLYHGSLVLSILASIHFCDLVYVYTSKENHFLIKKLKILSPNIILLNEKTLPLFFDKMDAYLAGPGWEKNKANASILKKILKTKKPAVIDATALHLIDKKFSRLLHQNVLLTPHFGEFEKLFSLPANIQNAKAMSKKYNCTILLKGQTDVISSPKKLKLNKIHHVGMTKGGTGDVLAGLCSSLMANHNPPFQSACAGAYLNGKAGILLSKREGNYYSSEELAKELAHAAKKG